MGLKLVFRARDCDWLKDVVFWWVEGQFGNSIYCFLLNHCLLLRPAKKEISIYILKINHGDGNFPVL